MSEMMRDFKDQDVRAAHIRLLDAVCQWERSTGREITVIVVPHDPDEPVRVSYNGKPSGREDLDSADLHFALGVALDERRRKSPR